MLTVLPPMTALNDAMAEDHKVDTTVDTEDATDDTMLILFSVWHPHVKEKKALQFDGLNVPAQKVGLKPPVQLEELQNHALQFDGLNVPEQFTALNPPVQLA